MWSSKVAKCSTDWRDSEAERLNTDLPLEARGVEAWCAACSIVIRDEDVEGGQVGGAWRAAGQLVGAVGDEGHRVEQALEGRGHLWDPAPAAGAGAAARRGGGGGGRCCHDSRIGIDGVDVPGWSVHGRGNGSGSGRSGKTWSADEPCFVCVSERATRRTKLFRPGQGPGSSSPARRAGKGWVSEVDPCCTSDAARLRAMISEGWVMGGGVRRRGWARLIGKETFADRNGGHGSGRRGQDKIQNRNRRFEPSNSLERA